MRHTRYALGFRNVCHGSVPEGITSPPKKKLNACTSSSFQNYTFTLTLEEQKNTHTTTTTHNQYFFHSTSSHFFLFLRTLLFVVLPTPLWPLYYHTHIISYIQSHTFVFLLYLFHRIYFISPRTHVCLFGCYDYTDTQRLPSPFYSSIIRPRRDFPPCVKCIFFSQK